jgi:hypothetical protein
LIPYYLLKTSTKKDRVGHVTPTSARSLKRNWNF